MNDETRERIGQLAQRIAEELARIAEDAESVSNACLVLSDEIVSDMASGLMDEIAKLEEALG